MTICERNNSADTKVSEEGGAADAPGTGAEIPLQPVEKIKVRQAVPLHPWRSMVEQISSCSLWRTPRWSRWMPKGDCDSAESPHWSRFSGRTCDLMGDSHWSSLFLKDCTLWKGPTLEHFMNNCILWEGPTLEKFVEDCLLWVGPHAGAGEECEEE